MQESKKRFNPNPNADQQEPQDMNRKTLTQIQTPLATKPDLINSPFTSFEEEQRDRPLISIRFGFGKADLAKKKEEKEEVYQNAYRK